jgi:hypothetical protein
MARRSADDLATRRPPRPDPKPPGPPAGLSLPGQRLWKEIVASKPHAWFDVGSLGALGEYCRAAVTCDLLDKEISSALAEDQPVVALRPLLDLRDRESRRLVSLAGKLRLLPSNRYRPDAAAGNRTPAGAPRPWGGAS